MLSAVKRRAREARQYLPRLGMAVLASPDTSPAHYSVLVEPHQAKGANTYTLAVKILAGQFNRNDVVRGSCLTIPPGMVTSLSQWDEQCQGYGVADEAETLYIRGVRAADITDTIRKIGTVLNRHQSRHAQVHLWLAREVEVGWQLKRPVSFRRMLSASEQRMAEGFVTLCRQRLRAQDSRLWQSQGLSLRRLRRQWRRGDTLVVGMSNWDVHRHQQAFLKLTISDTGVKVSGSYFGTCQAWITQQTSKANGWEVNVSYPLWRGDVGRWEQYLTPERALGWLAEVVMMYEQLFQLPQHQINVEVAGYNELFTLGTQSRLPRTGNKNPGVSTSNRRRRGHGRQPGSPRSRRPT